MLAPTQRDFTLVTLSPEVFSVATAGYGNLAAIDGDGAIHLGVGASATNAIAVVRLDFDDTSCDLDFI